MKKFSEYCDQQLNEAGEVVGVSSKDVPADLQMVLQQAEMTNAKFARQDEFLYVYPESHYLLRHHLKVLLQDDRFISVGSKPFGEQGLKIIFRSVSE